MSADPIAQGVDDVGLVFARAGYACTRPIADENGRVLGFELDIIVQGEGYKTVTYTGTSWRSI